MKAAPGFAPGASRLPIGGAPFGAPEDWLVGWVGRMDPVKDPMNLARPNDHTVNAWLRKKQNAGEPALAGELFVAYARF